MTHRNFTQDLGLDSEEEYRNSILNKVTSYHNKESKECPKCKEILPIEEFKDDTLISGVGNICKKCKVKKGSKKITKTALKIEKSSFKCPRCGGRLRKIRGRYGDFYGCSNYPVCRYTKKAYY